MKTAVVYNALTGRIETSATFDEPRSPSATHSQAVVWCQINAGGRPWLVWDGAATPEQHRVEGGVVVALPQAELVEQQWARVRYRRFQLLSDSDWRVTRAAETGVPMSEAWLAYRQALRDVTSQPDPFAIVWPAPPS